MSKSRFMALAKLAGPCFLSMSFVLVFGGTSALSREKVVYAFKGGSDGGTPWAGLTSDAAGNLYGATEVGGGGSCDYGGCGTVFKVSPDGTETILHDFLTPDDGWTPLAGVTLDAAGNIYGTTGFGGTPQLGTVFKLAPDGTETVLHVFQGGSDGIEPFGTLVLDSQGNVYGTTQFGGGSANCAEGCGTVFKIDSSGNEQVLYAFQGGTDGAEPMGSLVLDVSGNLYGATAGGGNSCFDGCGTIFEIPASGGESVLYSFKDDGKDGDNPTGGLTADASGNFYGTTAEGGREGDGTVFKYAPDGTETILHVFKGGHDGMGPKAGVILDNSGNLFGTTYYGSDIGCRKTGQGCGVVYEVTSKGQEKILYDFHGNRGRDPAAAVLLGPHSKLYGTAVLGGQYDQGVVFSVTK